MKIVNSDYWMNQTYIFVPENGDSFNDTLHSLHGGKWIPILFLLNKNNIASNTVVSFQVMINYSSNTNLRHLRGFENCVNFRILIESCVVQRENLKWLSFLLYVVLHNRAAAWEALSSRQT